MSFPIDHDYFHIKNRNSLTIIYQKNDENIEFMQRYGFIVKSNEFGLNMKLITEADCTSAEIDNIP